MKSEKRVIKALQRQEVDRIPSFEWSIDSKVINLINPGFSLEDFIYEWDIDAIIVSVEYDKEKISENVYKDEWGNIIKFTAEEHSVSEGCIKNERDLKKYDPPDPKKPSRFKKIEKIIEKHKNKKAIILHLNDVFSIPRNLLGYENLFMNIASNPKLINELIDLSININLELARIAVSKGIKIIFTGDDYAYDKGLLISPGSFKRLFLPGLKKIIKGFKELGLLVIKHTDGYIWPILDDIVNTGIDCIDPIDPVAGMRIKEVKEKYGHRIAIKGNVDCAQTLSFSSIEDVIIETKKCIRDGGPGYGYILSSSNSIHSGVKPENYVAMLKALKMYGKYPIKLEEIK